MYGLINRFAAKAGQREALLALMLDGTEAIPGCLSYVVARDPDDPDALWTTEVWESKAQWQAWTEIPAVRAAVERTLPLIASFGHPQETEPLRILPHP